MYKWEVFPHPSVVINLFPPSHSNTTPSTSTLASLSYHILSTGPKKKKHKMQFFTIAVSFLASVAVTHVNAVPIAFGGLEGHDPCGNKVLTKIAECCADEVILPGRRQCSSPNGKQTLLPGRTGSVLEEPSSSTPGWLV